MTELWQNILDVIESYTGLSAGTFVKLLLSAAVLLAYFALRWILVHIATRNVQEAARKYLAAKTIRYLLGALGLVFLIRIWVGGLAGIATYLGIVSAGIAIALQDPLANLAGWFYLIFRKPFVTGDRIQIGDHAGDVVDISLFQFTIVEIGNWVDADQSTGRIIHVPNGWVFKRPTCNYTQGFNFIWNELPVTITFESNWKKAKELLTEIAIKHSAVKSEHAAAQIRQAAKRFMIFYQHLTPIVWTSVAAYGVTLTIRYLCSPRNRRSTAGAMWEEILQEFAKCDDIDLAYPTTRYYRNDAEGKSALRPSPQPAGND